MADDTVHCVEKVNFESSTEKDLDSLSEDIVIVDGDDAPVGISWQNSKDVYQKSEKERKDAVDFLKSKGREKRRRKNELFVAQKRTKARTFELTKLPEEIVEAVALKSKKAGTEVTVEKKKELKKATNKKNKLSKERKKDAEYCNVVVNADLDKPKKVQQTAAEFLKNHLYGDRLQRMSTSSNLALRAKSSGCMKPALKFNC